jgi:hypothetical protein
LIYFAIYIYVAEEIRDSREKISSHESFPGDSLYPAAAARKGFGRRRPNRPENRFSEKTKARGGVSRISSMEEEFAWGI